MLRVDRDDADLHYMGIDKDHQDQPGQHEPGSREAQEDEEHDCEQSACDVDPWESSLDPWAEGRADRKDWFWLGKDGHSAGAVDPWESSPDPWVEGRASRKDWFGKHGRVDRTAASRPSDLWEAARETAWDDHEHEEPETGLEPEAGLEKEQWYEHEQPDWTGWDSAWDATHAHGEYDGEWAGEW